MARLRVLVRELEAQGKINSDALEKAGAVIRKLNEDLAGSLDAAGKIQADNQELREDLEHSRQ